MAKRDPLEETEEKLRRLPALPESSGMEPFQLLFEPLPEGVSDEVLVPALVALTQRLGVGGLDLVPAGAHQAILKALQALPSHPDAVFALAGLKHAQSPEQELHRWLSAQGLKFASRVKSRSELEASIKDPVVVAAAQAALVVTAPVSWRTSRHLPVVVADASPESLDLILPFVLSALETRDEVLDWFRASVVPLLGDNAATADLKRKLDAVVDERTTQSPALAFCAAIGLDPPPAKLAFTAAYFGTDPSLVGSPYPHLWQLKADSTKAQWFHYRRNEKWQWRPLPDPLTQLKAVLTGKLTRVTLKGSGKDLDRPRLQQWLESFLK